MMQAPNRALDVDGWHRRTTTTVALSPSDSVVQRLLQHGLLFGLVCIFWGVLLYMALTAL